MSKVLIIENNHNFRNALKSLMNSKYSAIVFQEAANAREAIEKINELIPDIIFSDISFSTEKSLELIERARKKCPSAIIVALSSENGAEYENAAIKSGADYHFSKNALNLGVMDELFAT
ncbi:MAG: response regulator [Desulfobacteraceae bacterium]|nr:MAG: response regulator [Desulfobacteraceae bacterium]